MPGFAEAVFKEYLATYPSDSPDEVLEILRRSAEQTLGQKPRSVDLGDVTLVIPHEMVEDLLGNGDLYVFWVDGLGDYDTVLLDYGIDEDSTIGIAVEAVVISDGTVEFAPGCRGTGLQSRLSDHFGSNPAAIERLRESFENGSAGAFLEAELDAVP